MFGKAVADRRVVVTGDYAADKRFVHAEATDSLRRRDRMRSMVVAPLTAGDEVFGALGTFSHAADAFTAPQIALVRALSDHAAFAMANAAPDRRARPLARVDRAPGRRSSARCASSAPGSRARDPGAVVQHTIDEALRLLDGDGRGSTSSTPRSGCSAACTRRGEEQILESSGRATPNERLEVGASGAPRSPARRTSAATTYRRPPRPRARGPTRTPATRASTGVIASPLFGDEGPFGAITVWSTRPDAFTPEHAALLETIAGQSAVALGRARLIEELGKSRETLARRAEEERALREIASRLGAMGDDPGDVLQRIVNEAARLLGGERARLDLVEPVSGRDLWTYPADTPFTDRLVAWADEVDAPPTGMGGLAVREARGHPDRRLHGDTRFEHYDEGDRGVTEAGSTRHRRPGDRRGGPARASSRWRIASATRSTTTRGG